MAKFYWAVGCNFDYSIVYCKVPDDMVWPGQAGPFRTLAEAKKAARAWIANDREHLAGELYRINKITKKDATNG